MCVCVCLHVCICINVCLCVYSINKISIINNHIYLMLKELKNILNLKPRMFVDGNTKPFDFRCSPHYIFSPHGSCWCFMQPTPLRCVHRILLSAVLMLLSNIRIKISKSSPCSLSRNYRKEISMLSVSRSMKSASRKSPRIANCS